MPRHLHAIPELMYDLPATSKFIRSQLDDMGISYRHPVAESGILATLGSGHPMVALRADMDALPIEARTSFQP